MNKKYFMVIKYNKKIIYSGDVIAYDEDQAREFIYDQFICDTYAEQETSAEAYQREKDNIRNMVKCLKLDRDFILKNAKRYGLIKEFKREGII